MDDFDGQRDELFRRQRHLMCPSRVVFRRVEEIVQMQRDYREAAFALQAPLRILSMHYFISLFRCGPTDVRDRSL